METLETQGLRANLVYCYGCRAEDEALLLELRMLHREMLRNLFFYMLQDKDMSVKQTWKCSDGDLENIGKHL